MPDLDVTIAVINHNTKDLLRECLTSILDSPPLVGYELRVVDNSSSDGSADMVKEEFPSIGLLANAGNLGFSAAANQAWRQSSARYLFLLNADTRVEPDCLESLVDFSDHHPEAAAVGPLVLNTDGTTQASARRFPSFTDAIMHAALGLIVPNNRFTRRYKMLDSATVSEREVDWVSGAAILLRRDVMDKVGLFDESYFMYVEDMDLCYRLRKAGYSVHFFPGGQVVHYVGQSSKQRSSRMVIEHERSMYRFYRKRYQGGARALMWPIVLLGLGVHTAMRISQNAYRSVAGRLAERGPDRKVGD